MKDGCAAVLEEILQRQTFLLSAHARPDGDAIGSMLALAGVLEQLGKTVELQLADRVPMIYEGLPGAGRIRKSATVAGLYDAIILLECDNVPRSRLGGLGGQFVINIDHHISGRPFANVNWIDPEACAVCALVYRLARAARVEVTPAMATCLYAGVLTDTGMFAFEHTDAEAFDLAASLVRLGAQPARIAQDIYFSSPTSKMRLLGKALTTLRREGRLAWMWVTQEAMQQSGAAEEDCEGLVNYAIGIGGVDAAVLLRELPDRRVRLSIRSKGSAVNVAHLAEQLGGGGHASASGCTLDGPLPAATAKITGILRDSLSGASSPGVSFEAEPVPQHAEV